MQVQERYYPPGYIGIEDAAFRIAWAIAPRFWAAAKIPAAEVAIWRMLNRGIQYNQLWLYLAGHSPKETWHEVRDRYDAYGEALTTLRKHLHAGSLVAEIRDASGRMDFVSAQVWGSDAAPAILRNGAAELIHYADQSTSRSLILLKEADVSSIMDALAPAPMRTGLAGRPSSVHLIIPEAKRRIEAGARPKSIRDFAIEMAAWTKQTPGVTPVTPKTLQGNPEFKALVRQSIIAAREEKVSAAKAAQEVGDE